MVPVVGDIVELDIDRVAHGGHCVGRVDGIVVFVRHTLPGERVAAAITGVGRKGRHLLAEAVTVLSAAPDRTAAPCPLSGPGGCGGCDWQHVTPAGQRELKTLVVAEQLSRVAGIEWNGEVQPVGPEPLSWRTRVRYAIGPDGAPGFRAAGSSDVVRVDECLIATDAVRAAEVDGRPVTGQRWEGVDELVVVDGPSVADRGAPRSGAADPGGAGATVVRLRRGRPGRRVDVLHRALGRDWVAPATGFWQAHRDAPRALADLVARAVGGTVSTDVMWDLYGGVGLLAGAARAAGFGGRITVVEGDRDAVRCARINLRDDSDVRIHRADVRAWLTTAVERANPVEVVVLDPPRSGAGASIMSLLTRTTARRLVYVACDPASLARDTRHALDAGWQLRDLEALDLFPMTHHVECVAVLGR